MSDQAIEQEIQTKGLNAPRVTPAMLEEQIIGEFYISGTGISQYGSGGIVLNRAVTLPDAVHQFLDEKKSAIIGASMGCLTICVLVLKVGFTVVGESACASPENFDSAIGRKIARGNAVAKIWPLMGYALRSDLYKADRSNWC